MQTALLPIMRDYLVRFQQTAIKETGRRPLCWLRSPKDEALVIPGCRRPGYAFWQPISWKDDQAPLGEHTAEFHQSIVDYLSLCQFLEIRFFLPVAGSGSPYSFLYRRVFEAERNTDSAPPEQKFQEALDYAAQRPELPLMHGCHLRRGRKAAADAAGRGWGGLYRPRRPESGTRVSECDAGAAAAKGTVRVRYLRKERKSVSARNGGDALFDVLYSIPAAARSSSRITLGWVLRMLAGVREVISPQTVSWMACALSSPVASSRMQREARMLPTPRLTA